jgi:hypothetical protein
MTNHDQNNQPLHLHDDPAHQEMESLLDSLAERERGSMPAGLESRVLDSIGRAVAPAPIAISSSESASSPVGFASLRFAAAAAILMGTSVVLWSTQPWATNTGGATNSGVTLVASLDQDLDAFFALESLDDGALSEAVTDWEIWAESVDTDIDTTLVSFDWFESAADDGAL